MKKILHACKFLRTYAIFISTLLLLWGCNNKLDRETAEKLIITEERIPVDETQEITLEKNYKTVFKTKNDTEHNRPAREEMFSKLEEEGLITYEIEQVKPYIINESWYGQGMGIKSPTSEQQRQRFLKAGYWREYIIEEHYKHIGTLTDKGKQYQLSNGQFKTASISFGEITGIKELNEKNTSEVLYTTKRTSITPFGKILGLKEEIFKKSKIFRKFDDGWRADS